MDFFFLSVLMILCGILYMTRNLIFRILKSFKDLFIFVFILLGQRSSDQRSANFRSKLNCYLLEADLIDITTVDDVGQFALEHLETSISPKDFHKFLRAQTYIGLFRDCVAGTLRGITFARLIRKEKYTIVNTGTTIIAKQYQSDGSFQTVGFYIFLKEMVQHPFTPLYGIAKLFGYKSYLSLCKSVGENLYPRYNKETPEYLKDIMYDFVKTVLKEEENYDRDTFVLKRKTSVLKDFDAAITEEDMKDPDIKFYAETNPGYTTGDCLMSLTVLNWYSLFTLSKRAFLRGITRKSPRPLKSVPEPRFGRHLSIIDKSTEKYYVPQNDKKEEKEKSSFLYRRATLTDLGPESPTLLSPSDLSF